MMKLKRTEALTDLDELRKDIAEFEDRLEDLIDEADETKDEDKDAENFAREAVQVKVEVLKLRVMLAQLERMPA